MNSLKLTRLLFEAKASQNLLWPEYIGNKLRGLLGYALVDLYCILPESERRSTQPDNELDTLCRTCAKKQTCPFAQVFKVCSETSVPQPFSIGIHYIPGGRGFAAGEKLEFDITLFGSTSAFKEEIKKAVISMLPEFEVVSYEHNRKWSDENNSSIQQVGKLHIDFLTPLQIYSSKKLILEPSFNEFTDNLFSRLADIIQSYGEGELILPYALMNRKPRITAEYSLKSIIIPLEKGAIRGVIGSVSYYGDISQFMPYIDIGTWIHAGKQATRGCGKYSF